MEQPRESESPEVEDKPQEIERQDETLEDEDSGREIETTSTDDKQPGPSRASEDDKEGQSSAQAKRKERLQRLRELHMRRVSINVLTYDVCLHIDLCYYRMRHVN